LYQKTAAIATLEYAMGVALPNGKGTAKRVKTLVLERQNGLDFLWICLFSAFWRKEHGHNGRLGINAVRAGMLRSRG